MLKLGFEPRPLTPKPFLSDPQISRGCAGINAAWYVSDPRLKEGRDLPGVTQQVSLGQLVSEQRLQPIDPLTPPSPQVFLLLCLMCLGTVGWHGRKQFWWSTLVTKSPFQLYRAQPSSYWSVFFPFQNVFILNHSSNTWLAPPCKKLNILHIRLKSPLLIAPNPTSVLSQVKVTSLVCCLLQLYLSCHMIKIILILGLLTASPCFKGVICINSFKPVR